MGRRWRIASSAEFFAAAIAFLVGWRWAGIALLAAGLFAHFAAWWWEGR